LQLTDALPKARFNRKRTLAGGITLCYANEAAAAQGVLLFMDIIPDEGSLKVLSYGAETTFAKAVITDVTATRIGITVFAKLTFAVGPGVVSNVAIVTPDTGLIVGTEDGKIITS